MMMMSSAADVCLPPALASSRPFARDWAGN